MSAIICPVDLSHAKIEGVSLHKKAKLGSHGEQFEARSRALLGHAEIVESCGWCCRVANATHIANRINPLIQEALRDNQASANPANG